MSTVNPSPELNARELAEIAVANSSNRPVVVFVHGLWMLADSWDSWRRRFENRGYVTVAPGWPGDPASVDQAREQPAAMAGNSLGAVAMHYAGVIGQLREKPIVVGHSFGGLVAQQLAGMGLASCTVAISPAPGRGIWRTPASSVRSTWPVLRNPANRARAVSLTFDQFRYSFAGAVDVEQARYLYDTYAVPGAGRLIFQTAFANLNAKSEARVNTAHPHRGPLKIISGERDRIVPWSVAHAAFRMQQGNPAPTEFYEAHLRGHSLVIDNGWTEVADTALRFVHRFSARN